MTEKIYSFLGLATKAGKLASGNETSERAVVSGKAVLVIIASDASENTKKQFEDMCRYRNIPVRIFGLKDLLGRYTGKNTRSVIAIMESGFADRLTEMIDRSNESGGDLNG